MTETAVILVPCAAAKAEQAMRAEELYTSPNFAHTLNAAKREAEATAAELGVTAKVMILSARHGLLDLDDVVEPYDTKMGDADDVEVTELIDQLVSLAPKQVVAMLPSTYYQPVWEAVTEINENGSDEDPWIDLLHVYEAAPGIGYQRGVATSLTRTYRMSR